MSVTERDPRRAASPEGATPDEAGSAPDDRRTPVEILVLALGALAAGVVLRFVARTPLWLDEALTVNISRLPLGDLPAALKLDGHPPLFYALLHVWMQVFGTGDIAVRALAGVFALAALPLAWIAGRRRGGPVLGWLTVGVLALSPYALRYATETRMYSLVTLLVLAGYLLIDDVVRSGRDNVVRLVGLALVTVALLYSHYWALWLVGAVVALLVGLAWRGHDPALRRRARRALVAVVLGGLCFAPWLPVMLFQSAHTGTPWASPARPTSVIALTFTDFGGGGFGDAPFGGFLLGVLALLALFGRAVDRRRVGLDLRTEPQFRWEALMATAGLGLGLVVMYLSWSAFASRYAAAVFPLVVLLVAGGLTRFADRRVRAGAFAALLAFSLLGAYWVATYQRTQARVIGRAVAARVQPGDLVVFCPDQLGPDGSRALPPGVDQVVYPTFGPPDRVDWRDYAARNAAADPAAFAARAVERAGPTHAIYVIWNGEYKTLEGQCEALVDAIGTLRPGGSTVVAMGSTTTYFEHAALVTFPPVG